MTTILEVKQRIKEYLLKYNINSSVQRIEIMRYLLEHKTHPTVDEIYTNLIESVPTLSKTTVYNTLKLFYEQGAITCLTIDEKNVRFDGNNTPHAHLRCRKCDKIYDLGEVDTSVFPFQEDIRDTEMHLYFVGICKRCKN